MSQSLFLHLALQLMMTSTQEQLLPKFHMNIGGRDCIGILQTDGNLHPDMNDLERMIDSFKRGVIRKSMGRPTRLLEWAPKGERVYKLRSGILLPMILDEKRGLIPEVGEAIIDIKDYTPGPDARPIYNHSKYMRAYFPR